MLEDHRKLPFSLQSLYTVPVGSRRSAAQAPFSQTLAFTNATHDLRLPPDASNNPSGIKMAGVAFFLGGSQSHS